MVSLSSLVCTWLPRQKLMSIALPSSSSVLEEVHDWTDDELFAAVTAYLQMLTCELEGVAYVKSAVNRSLRAGPLAARKKGAIEFRMQNISATLYDLRLPYIRGYLPAKNVGSGVKSRIKAALQSAGIEKLRAYGATSNPVILEQRVSTLRKKPIGAVPRGRTNPPQVASPTTSFVRDPAVKNWVLQTANGVCEGCDSSAPFLGMDGYAYLEVHHVLTLAGRGSDTTTNAVALCPNCHRRCHFSSDRDEFKVALYEKVDRLEIEVPDIDILASVFIDGQAEA